MARTELTAQRIDRTGLVASYTAAITDGHSVRWGERVFVHIRNNDTVAKTITVPTPQTISGLNVAEHTVDVAAGDETFIGPFLDRATFQQDDGTVWIDYSSTTSVDIAALQI